MKLFEKLRGKSLDERASSYLIAFLLTVAGGYQDAYTYYTRGKVFANGQAGNVLFCAHEFLEKNFSHATRYILPMAAFIIGVSFAEFLQYFFCQKNRYKNWLRITIFAEMILLFAAAFVPHSADIVATILVSIACSLQVDAFRKIGSAQYSSTMCLGNFRSMGDTLFDVFRAHNKKALLRFFPYLFVIVAYVIGAQACMIFSQFSGDTKSIFGSLVPLIFCAVLL